MLRRSARNEDDYNVLENGVLVRPHLQGAPIAPQDRPGCGRAAHTKPTREAAMVAIAKSWRPE